MNKRQALDENMQRMIEKGPKYKARQHVLAIGAVFGLTVCAMYYMRQNVEQTMPWRSKKKE